MLKLIFICILISLQLSISGQYAPSAQSPISGYSYYPPKNDKESWQRLYLLLSSTFITVVNEGQVDLDSSLLKASSSLGLSRYSILAEGFGDEELLKQSYWIDQRDPATGIRLLSKAQGRSRVQFLLLLGAYYAFQRDSYFKFKDSVEYFLSKAIYESKQLKEDRLERHALCLLGKIYVQAHDPMGDSIYNQLINNCIKAGDKEIQAKALVYRSRFTPPLATTFLKKIADTQEASEIYHNLGNAEGEINALTDAGYLLTVSVQMQLAQESFQKAYDLALAIQFPYIHYNAQTLSMITTFQGKFGEPFRYTLQMIKVAENCRDSIGWGYFHANLALMLSSEGRYEESLNTSKKAINYFIRERNPTVYNLLPEVIFDMSKKGQEKEALLLTQDISKKVKTPITYADQFGYHYAFAICYMYLNRLAMAEIHIKKMDSVESKAELIRGPGRRIVITELQGLIMMNRGEYVKARELLEKRFTTPNLTIRPLQNDLDLYQTLIEIDSLLGDQESAIRHYKSYNALLDSTFKVTKIRQAEELQVLYQIQEKENQISLLTKQAELEKENSEKSALVKNLTIAGIFAVMIIAGLLYRQNRLKQKSNRLITRKNEQLQDLLSEKEWLLKEIHHRVKNNLQIAISLLNSQSAYIDNDAALTAINDSQRRMHAMALIHQKLYLSENISTIHMPDYINELVTYAQDSFDYGNNIIFEQAIEPLDLDVSQAIPLGLIINEGLVNALKYAFPNERKGIVSITLSQPEPYQLILEISDNGIGLPSELDIMKHNSLGFDLMKGLAKQLNGNLTMESKNGLSIKLKFMKLFSHLMEKSAAN